MCGGLTVLTEIKNLLPNKDIIYLGDTLHFPYGPKTKEEIIQYGIANVEFFKSKGANIIVIACGTATSQAEAELKDKYNIPIVRHNKANSRIHKKLKYK